MCHINTVNLMPTAGEFKHVPSGIPCNCYIRRRINYNCQRFHRHPPEQLQQLEFPSNSRIRRNHSSSSSTSSRLNLHSKRAETRGSAKLSSLPTPSPIATSTSFCDSSKKVNKKVTFNQILLVRSFGSSSTSYPEFPAVDSDCDDNDDVDSTLFSLTDDSFDSIDCLRSFSESDNEEVSTGQQENNDCALRVTTETLSLLSDNCCNDPSIKLATKLGRLNQLDYTDCSTPMTSTPKSAAKMSAEASHLLNSGCLKEKLAEASDVASDGDKYPTQGYPLSESNTIKVEDKQKQKRLWSLFSKKNGGGTGAPYKTAKKNDSRKKWAHQWRQDPLCNVILQGVDVRPLLKVPQVATNNKRNLLHELCKSGWKSMCGSEMALFVVAHSQDAIMYMFAFIGCAFFVLMYISIFFCTNENGDYNC